MLMTELTEQFRLRGLDFSLNTDLKSMTTLKIGGKADLLVLPRDVDEVRFVLRACREHSVPVFFMGNGSNLLVRDGGLRGVVMKLGPQMAKATVCGNLIHAGAGISMAKLAAVAAEHGLTGFEFASGIPGSLGGGIVMNAGAYKGEMKHVVRSVTALCHDGYLRTFSQDQLDFSYRHSVFTGSDMLVMSAVIELRPGNEDAIRDHMAELAAKRRRTQPLDYPSAGSAFKRPAKGYAAAMIDACGLKGYAVGGARVSEKHAGFVINFDHASADDVETLLSDVRRQVGEALGTWLEPEIVIIGEPLRKES